MYTLVEQALMIAILLAFALCNSFLGFLGTVAGEYRIRKNQGRRPSFVSLWKEKEDEFWRDHAAGDPAPVVAAIIFAHIGIVFLLLVWFGPIGQDKPTESRINLK